MKRIRVRALNYKTVLSGLCKTTKHKENETQTTLPLNDPSAEHRLGSPD